MSYVDLASEMAAARKRRAEQTAQALREARVLAVRAVARPGSTPTEIEEVARSFYPRLAPELIAEVTNRVCELQRGRSAAPVEAELPAELLADAEAVELEEPVEFVEPTEK